jgi:NTE family protein
MEELFTTARHPLPGDQIAWGRLGVGKDFYNSWWGSLRGELFTTYGMAMNDWSNTEEMWEAGVSLSVPGQLLSGRVLLVYNNDDEFVFGFTLGNPNWHSSILP